MRINGKIIKWRRLGSGGFNKTSVSNEPFSLTIEGVTYHQYWVLKIPNAFRDCELSHKMNAPTRAVRIWNSMHPHTPAIECPELGGWLAPYKGSLAATDEETATQQLEDYRIHRRIFADACGDHNYLNVSGKIECIDVDVSHHRDSPLGKRIDDEVIQLGEKGSPYAPYWFEYAHKYKRPRSVQMTKTLLYLEQQLDADDILDCYLIPEVIEQLHFYQKRKLPISAHMLQSIFEEVMQPTEKTSIQGAHVRFFTPIEQAPSTLRTQCVDNDMGSSCTIS